MRTGQFMVRVAAILVTAAPLAFGQAAASSSSRPRLLISSSVPVSASTAPGEEILRADRLQPRQAMPALAAAQPPIIHAGDHVIVEENTAVVEARLEATAMSPAQAGSPLNVRLTMGGKVLRVLAAAPGRAVLQKEVQR
ncbi:MAG: hypothetical protein ABR987_03350 [Terracidiphilus sp.]